MNSSTSSSSDPAPPAVTAGRRFADADLVGEVRAAFPVTIDELRRLIDPAAAEKTIHWGRNYLYRARLRGGAAGGPAAEIPVVVKMFRGDGWRQRLSRRFKGSKAERSLAASVALLEAGVPVPQPVAAIESSDPRGPSFFVCEHLDGAVEARYLFRAMSEGRERELFPELDPARVLERLGTTLERLHRARLWHRDVSAGNVLLVGDWSGAAASGELYLIDLARTRIGKPLTRGERVRDLARLPLQRPADRDRLLESYFGGTPPLADRLLFAIHHHAFHVRHRVKDRLRGLRRLLRSVKSRNAHPHLPPAGAGSAARDRVVWDALSDQPHLHAGRMAKLGARLADASVHAREAALLLRRLPAVAARYHALSGERHAAPVAVGEPGVGIQGGSAPAPDLVAEIEALGVRRVLLRLQPWENQLERDSALARELHARGIDVVLAVAQNRELVRDPGRWRALLEEIAERFAGLATHAQIGHAINRSKWGIWNQREYAELVTIAAEVLLGRSGARAGWKIVGPSVIDFELYATCIALDWPENPVRFDAVTSLLYVDRRGAPENRQAGLDAVAKARLVRAIIQTSRHGDRESWITEVNWPLREGPHSPAGRHVAVGEEAQADYLARYYLLLLGSGLVERIYWWQLVARGYGLADPEAGGLRRRPSWGALAFLTRALDGSRALGPIPASRPLRVHAFERPGGWSWLVVWSAEDSIVAWRPPATARRLFDRDGKELVLVPGGEIRVGGSPIYIEIQASAQKTC
jgi:tRNA A-37 threonylcarbamoyl transferase component Bud32